MVGPKLMEQILRLDYCKDLRHQDEGLLSGKLKTQGSGTECSLRVATRPARPLWAQVSTTQHQAGPLQGFTFSVLGSLGLHCQEAHSSPSSCVTQAFWVCEPAHRSAQRAYHPCVQSLLWVG